MQEPTEIEIKNTRSEIASAALHLFAYQGFDGTSIREIVEAAGVTKPVLYYHFKSKEELYLNLIHGVYEGLLNELEKIINDDSTYLERFRRVLNIYIEISEEDEKLIRLIYGAIFGSRRSLPPVDIKNYEEKHRDILAGFFSEGMRLNYIREIPVESVVFHFMGTINYYLMRTVGGEGRPGDVGDRLLDMLINGIGGYRKES